MSSVTGSTARGDVTRRALLDAATVRFARDGYRATSVADICRDAALGGTTAYVHFANKEALFLAAVDEDLASLFARFERAVTSLGPRTDWVDGLFSSLLEAVDEHPLARRLLAGQEPTITARVLETDAFDELRAIVARRLAQAQDGGVIRPDLSAALLGDGLVATVVAVAMASVQIGDAVLDTFGPGLGALLGAILTPDPRVAR